MKLEHVALNVAEPGLMAAWYAENLGMEIVLGLIEPPFTHFLADSERVSMLEFYHNPVAPVPDYASMHPVMLHMAFSVEDMQGARSKLLAAGATAEGEIVTTAVGDQLAFLRDPWQVALQLVKRRTPLLGV